MSKDPADFLNELPIWKLKAVAEYHRIDVAGCRYKRDYVDKLRSKKVTEEQARAALKNAEKHGEPKDTSEEAVREVKEIGKDLASIAEKPVERMELPTDEEKTVDRHLDEALTMKPRFFEVDSANESAMNRMILGDYHEAIKVNREARIKCLDGFSTFQVYSAALSIRAADELLAKLPKEKIDPGLHTAAAAAKRAFVHGTPRQREEALENLESLAMKAYEAYWNSSQASEVELRNLIADYESFGTRTQEARRYLDVAASAKQSMNLDEHARLLAQARAAAESAKKARAAELGNTYHLVRAATAEARESGAEVPAAEGNLAEAKSALESGSFRRAVELLADVERAADAAHSQKLATQKDLEKSKLEKVNLVVASYGPVMKEASSYGFDVQEPMYYAGNIRAALDRKDVVNAAKFARRVKEIMDGMEGDLDKKRIEKGVARPVADAKCGKCGAESLYVFPNSVQKCTDCGHSFVIPESEPVQQVPAVSAQSPPVISSPQVHTQSPAQTPQTGQPTEKKKRWLKW
ncbi:MAG TPA: hypothetical protein VF374_03630 [Thermoplasmata archaeon]